MNGIKTEYSLDNDWILARQRLALLEAHTDVGTIRFLDALDVGDGWRCLEVGGGGGSITEWLCRRVGPTGRVVATDINTRFLDALDFENLERCVHTTLSWTDSNKECWTSFTLATCSFISVDARQRSGRWSQR